MRACLREGEEERIKCRVVITPKFRIKNIEALSATKYSHNREETDLHREEEGTENQAMETRHTSHTASFLA